MNSTTIPQTRQMYRYEGGLIFVNATQSHQQRLQSMGRFEPNKTAFLKSWWRPYHTFVDVGASCGYFTLLAAHYLTSGFVHAIEPAVENVYYLERAVKMNQYDHVTIHPVAVSDKNGEADFYLAQDDGQHNLRRVKKGMRRTSVNLRRLDDILPPRHVDSMKIDVEGEELAMLQGAERILSSPGKMALAMDLHPHYHDDNPTIGQILQHYGFRLFDPRTNMEPVSVVRYNYHELIAIKDE